MSYLVCVGWCEMDTAPRDAQPVPSYDAGQPISRYGDKSKNEYEVPIKARQSTEAEDEEIIVALLMEISNAVL